MSIFDRNLNTTGRIIRGTGALLLAAVAFFTWPYSITAAGVLSVSALLVAFEALRGWCALRACGLKTKF